MIYIAVQLIQIFSAQPRGSEVVQEVLADLKREQRELVKLGLLTSTTSQEGEQQALMV